MAPRTLYTRVRYWAPGGGNRRAVCSLLANMRQRIKGIWKAQWKAVSAPRQRLSQVGVESIRTGFKMKGDALYWFLARALDWLVWGGELLNRENLPEEYPEIGRAS